MAWKSSLLSLCLVASTTGCDNDTGRLGGLGGSAGASAGSGGATGGSSGAATGGAAGSGGSGGAAGTGGAGGVAGSSGSAGADGGAQDGGVQDGGAQDGGGGTDGGHVGCNYLTLIGLQVTAVPTGGAAPTASGGTITDGFYKLVGVNLYGGAVGTKFWRTLRFVGSELKTVERDGAAVLNVTSTGTYQATGAGITRNLTCPSTNSESFSYTASSNTFTAYVDQGGGKISEFIYQWDSK